MNVVSFAPLVVDNFDKKAYANGEKPSYNDPAKVLLTGTTSINVKGTSSACPAIHVAAANDNIVYFDFVKDNVTINS